MLQNKYFFKRRPITWVGSGSNFGQRRGENREENLGIAAPENRRDQKIRSSPELELVLVPNLGEDQKKIFSGN